MPKQILNLINHKAKVSTQDTYTNLASHTNTNPPPPYTVFTPAMARQMIAYPNVRVGVNDHEVNYDDDDVLLSSINISISSPFIIKGDNNLVSLDPHQAASAIG